MKVIMRFGMEIIMRMYDLILKKRSGDSLSKEEIQYMIDGYTNGSIPDYQMSAMMMAIYFEKMNDRETVDLTLSMANSGDTLDLSEIDGIKVDKHSTGGVGDKTSLVLTPMVAACGVPVAKMSGRGLGHTGGTIDKLHSFPGFSTELTEKDFIQNVNRVKVAIMEQTANLAPADKKLYALRDVTGTVENISLIASSIMSKKIAAGADAIVLDVKTGSGAFMTDEEGAIELAQKMVMIGTGAGRETTAIISDMNQPLGFAVGNALEVKEAIDTLSGRGPEDLVELCLTLGSYMLVKAKRASDTTKAREMLEHTICDGTALDKLAEFVSAQGGDKSSVYDVSMLPQAKIIEEITSINEGYIKEIKCKEIGMCSLILGGGRETLESTVDLSVGVVLHKKIGDYVRKNESLATIYANDREKMEEAKKRFLQAYDFSSEAVPKVKFIKRIITA